MKFAKKWLSTIVSFVAGVCGLILSACPGMIIKISSDSSAVVQGLKATGLESETTKAFKVLTDSKLYDKAKLNGLGDEFMTMKIFAIFTLIVSVLLIVYAIVMLLKNLKVIKSKSKIFDLIGIVLFVLLLVATIGLLISSSSFAGAQQDKINSAIKVFMPTNWQLVKVKVGVGAYQPTMLVISIISALAVGFVTFAKKKR